MKKTMTLFLPGLLSLPSKMMPAMPALSTLLSRSRQYEEGGKAMEFTLKSLFRGLGATQIPAGALSALSHGLITAEDNRYWCRIDLVACLVDHRGVYILKKEDPASQLKVLNTFLQQDNIHIKEGGSEWFAAIPSHVDVTMNDLLEVLGKNMSFLLPSGPDQTYWRRLLTECQMLLQPTSANEQSTSHQPLVSSVWFWGMGKLPQKIETEFDFIYTKDSIVKGLAICAKTPCAKMPLQWDLSKAIGENMLFSDMEFYNLSKHQLEEKHCQLLAYYEENWFGPLLEALKKGQIDMLKLIFADGRLFNIKKIHLKFFWKKIFPVQKFIST